RMIRSKSGWGWGSAGMELLAKMGVGGALPSRSKAQLEHRGQPPARLRGSVHRLQLAVDVVPDLLMRPAGLQRGAQSEPQARARRPARTQLQVGPKNPTMLRGSVEVHGLGDEQVRARARAQPRAP